MYCNITTVIKNVAKATRAFTEKVRQTQYITVLCFYRDLVTKIGYK